MNLPRSLPVWGRAGPIKGLMKGVGNRRFRVLRDGGGGDQRLPVKIRQPTSESYFVIGDSEEKGGETFQR